MGSALSRAPPGPGRSRTESRACSQPPADSPTSAAGAPGRDQPRGDSSRLCTGSAASTSAAPVAAPSATSSDTRHAARGGGWNTAPTTEGSPSPGRADDVRVVGTPLRPGCVRCRGVGHGRLHRHLCAGVRATAAGSGFGHRCCALEVVVRAPYLGTSDHAWRVCLGSVTTGGGVTLSGWRRCAAWSLPALRGSIHPRHGVREKRAFRMWTLESADRQRVYWISRIELRPPPVEQFIESLD